MRSSSFGFVVIIMIGLSTLNLPLDMNVDKGGGGVNGDCGREESASDSGWNFHRVTKSVCG